MTGARLAFPPGPRGLDVLRFFGGGSFANTLAYFEEVAQRYGPIASFRVLGRRLHLVTGPDLVREVLVVAQHDYTRANGAAILRDLLGKSVLTVDEPQHRERRRLLQPAFHSRRIAAYAAAIVAQASVACANWADGERVDIGPVMTRVALASVGRAIFGNDVHGGADALEHALTPAMRVVSWLGPILEALPPWGNELRLRLPLPANAALRAARAELARIVRDAIHARCTARYPGDDLLAMLLAARDPRTHAPLDAQAIADELVTMLLAGHETTANALTWAWLALACDPALQARMYAEIAAAVDDRREPDAGDLPHLRLTAHVFAEALRLYPPASAFGRRALRDCTLGGYAVAAGDGILMSPYVNHRCAATFDEPLRFKPERWDGAAYPAFAYYPFGGGSRICIGEAFARMEGTLVLATIARRFTLLRTDDATIGIARHATLRPARPVVLEVHARSTGRVVVPAS